MKISVLTVGKWSDAQVKKVGEAVEVLNKILANPKFIEAIEALDPNKYFSGTLHGPRQIAQILSVDSNQMIHAAVWNPPFWKRFSSAIAYESNNRVNLRNSYIANGRVLDLAATILHEFMHSIGYTHDFWNTKRRPYSVPYAVGRLVTIWRDGIFEGAASGSIDLK